ncbi:MAG: oligopeptide:H+ symporter [Coxiellaceae bacterium]|nr:oligopeptide:H+ symporter [Coxiellaceae bacterium]
MTKKKHNHKHPTSLWWFAVIFSFFMFSFGSLLASLVLHLHMAEHMPLKQAYAIFGAFASMMWTLPLIGGYLSSKCGYKPATGVGIVVIVIGLICLACPDVWLNRIGLSMFVVGNALFTPALWCLVDYGYAKHDTKRESGFTYFYLSFNLGAVIGIALGGYVATRFNFNMEMALDAVVVFIGMLLYFYKIRSMQFHSKRIFYHSFSTAKSLTVLIATMVVGIPIGALLLKYTLVNDWIMYALCIIALVAVLWLAFSYKDKQKRYKIIAFMILVIVSIAFWSLYNLEPSLLSVFISQNVDRHVFGITMPATSFFAFEGTFIILIGLIMSRVWLYLSTHGKDLPLMFKFSFSLCIMGLAFLWLVLGTHVFGSNHLMPFFWMVATYAFFATSELFVGPIGISMVGKLSPPGKEGEMMGVWQLYQGLAAVVGASMAGLVVVPSHSTLHASNQLYDHLFLTIGISVIVLGLVLMCFVPLMKRLIPH